MFRKQIRVGQYGCVLAAACLLAAIVLGPSDAKAQSGAGTISRALSDSKWCWVWYRTGFDAGRESNPFHPSGAEIAAWIGRHARLEGAELVFPDDRNSTLLRVPCEPPNTGEETAAALAFLGGFYFGLEGSTIDGHLVSTERLNGRDDIISVFRDYFDPFGGGVLSATRPHRSGTTS
jgi:hypothetical protein